MKSSPSLRVPSSGLLTVQVFKRNFPWTSPSVLSVLLMPDGHGAAPGLPHWRLSAAWREILRPWAVLTAPVSIYEASRGHTDGKMTFTNKLLEKQPQKQNCGFKQNLDGGITYIDLHP